MKSSLHLSFFLSKNWIILFIQIFISGIVYSQVSNYTFSESINTYTPLSGATTLYSGSWNDPVPATVGLPFTFIYNNVGYNSITVSPNGYITFGATGPANNLYTPISSTTAYDGAISGLGFNLESDGNSGATVSHRSIGAIGSRVYVIQWLNVYRVGPNGTFNFQIRLYEGTNQIRVHYGACNPTNNNNNGAVQVGLRGFSNADINSRTKGNDELNWSNNTSIGVASSTVNTRNNSQPNNGLEFIWTPFVPTPAILDYVDGFEGANNWILNNGTQINKWYVGSFINNGGVNGLYVSNNGFNNNYSNTTSTVHAYRDITIPVGETQVGVYFDWRANGDVANNDFLRVWLVPQTYYPTPGTPITAGGGRIQLNGMLNHDNNWKTQFNENVDITSFAGSTMRLVFEWLNDGVSRLQFAAAVDNVRVLRYCSGTPTGGTVAITPATGAPSSVFNGSVTGGTVSAGVQYQWQISENAGGPWADIVGATDAEETLTAVPIPGVTRYYRRRTICTISNQTVFSTVGSFTTTSPTYCTPTADGPAGLYISNVKIFGMNPAPINNTTTYAANGYSNYTGNSSLIAQQAQGEGVNIEAAVNGNYFGRGRWKAWVDWNGDGDFTDAGEEVYNVGAVVGGSLNFGFQVPVNQTPGDYRIRIRVNNGDFFGETYGFNYSPCDNFTFPNEFGETEDYLVRVIENCVAKIATVTAGEECLVDGGIAVSLSATSSVPVTEFRWYSSEIGGSYVTSPPDGTGMATTWDTPLLTQTTYYYVTAFNGVCESTFRTKIKAEIKPTPTISFTPSTFDVCGDISVIEVSATGDNEIVHLVNENFDGIGLGAFANQVLQGNYNNANFINRTSVYKPTSPPFMSWLPAISSGFGSNQFVLSSSDFNAGMTLHRGLISASLNTNGFQNLTLKFRMLFSRYFQDNVDPASEYAAIEITTNGGGAWTEIERFTIDVGKATNFEERTYNLDAYINQTIRFRFVMYSYSSGTGWLPTGLAIDDVELYGEKALDPSFNWVSDNPIGVYTDAAGTIEYTGGPISTVYIKPDDTQVEDYESWDITATALLNNGCSASGVLEINNFNKVWNTTASNWATLNWEPSASVPTAEHCVLVRTPVLILGSTDGLAKNLTVQSGGSLTIQSEGSLTLTDFLINEESAAAFVVDSDASFLQINAGALNSGEITVKREATVPSNQYNYWSSPVADQDLYNLYENIPNFRVMTYNTWNNYFTILPLGVLSDFGVGYSIKGPSSGGPIVMAEFIGAPHNESLTSTENRIPLSIAYDGYNLIGNPYPSNLNLDMLYNLHGNDSAITGSYYFWDNTNNTWYSQQGSGYTGNNYAIYNANSGGIPAGGGDTAKVPNGIVKPGQGFIVNELPGASYLTVDNTMRTKEVKMDPMNPSDPEAPYYKNGNGMSDNAPPRKDKFWVELISPGGIHTKILIGYFNQAENTFEKFDSKLLNPDASDNFYSFSQDDQKLSIQGRKGPFQIDDVIPLGVKMFHSGHHIIQVDERLGLFISYQDVYLKDKWLNVIHNISETGYEFESINGEFNDRFEIVFEDGAAEDNPILISASQVQIQKINKEIVISSQKDKLKEVEIFNFAGWSVYKDTQINALEVKIPMLQFGKGIVVIKVQTETGEVVSQKMIIK